MRGVTILVLGCVACALPRAGAPRGEAYASNAVALGLGAFIGGPAAAISVHCRDGSCSDGAHGAGTFLLLGAAIVAAGILGMTATAAGKTCPAGKSMWNCVGTAAVVSR